MTNNKTSNDEAVNYIGIMKWCKKCGGSNANCTEYTKQPHYVINAVSKSNTSEVNHEQ